MYQQDEQIPEPAAATVVVVQRARQCGMTQARRVFEADRLVPRDVWPRLVSNEGRS